MDDKPFKKAIIISLIMIIAVLFCFITVNTFIFNDSNNTPADESEFVEVPKELDPFYKLGTLKLYYETVDQMLLFDATGKHLLLIKIIDGEAKLLTAYDVKIYNNKINCEILEFPIEYLDDLEKFSPFIYTIDKDRMIKWDRVLL